MVEDEKAYTDPPLMTIPEAARYLGVGKKIIYQLIDRDEIRAVRKHGATLVDKRSLEAFRSSGKLT